MPSKNLHPRNASTTCPRAPGSPLPYPTTMSSIFTSIEFYITALAVAVAIIAFFGSSDDTPRASSDIYTPTTQAERVNATPSVILRAMPDGTIEITRQGLTLHGNCSIYINAEFIKDRITLTEKIASGHHGIDSSTYTQCTLHFATRPLPRKKYFIRYESPDNALWGTTRFANYGGYSVALELKP